MAVRGLRRRAVLLDAMGTLVELEPPVPRLRAELSRRFGVSVSDAQAELAVKAEIAHYRAHLDEGRDESSLRALRMSCAEVLRQELQQALGRNLPGGQSMVDALLASLSFRPFSDVVPALTVLKDLGLSLLVLSNWDVSLPDVLRRIGIAPYLDGVLTSAQAGARKPDPALFQAGLELGGVSAEEAIHVGDSLREDVAGARAAGVAPVLLVRKGGDDPAGGVPRIRTLAELPGLLAKQANQN